MFQKTRGRKSSQPLPWGHWAYMTPCEASKVALPSVFSLLYFSICSIDPKCVALNSSDSRKTSPHPSGRVYW